MRLISIMIFFLLCFSWLNSLTERFPCDNDHIDLRFELISAHGNGLATEAQSGLTKRYDGHSSHECHFGFCHFGHCSHVYMRPNFQVPNAIVKIAPFHTYTYFNTFQTGFSDGLVRPPSLG